MTSRKLTPVQKEYLSGFGLEDIDPDGLIIRNYKKGELICEQGAPLEDLLIVTEGRTKVCSMAANGKTLLFCFNDPGTILGEVELMTHTFTSSSVFAITDVQCIIIPNERYRDYLLSNIKFMNRICLIMAEIVAQNSINNASNILYPFESRLCAYISMTQENGRFCQKLTELAEFFGTSYRHLLRTLDNLCTKGLIEKTPQGYVIKDDLKLRKLGINYIHGKKKYVP
ncbi:MAG TPA: cyclic nucleotide-binding domain-containing protein [Anaerovoracaceae bacterium]|nr:cyclic nucleotide-binding domain-containing protein [Anaerovoracaceae bacterium]